MERLEGYSERHLIFLRWALIASLGYMLVIREDGAVPSTLELGYLAVLLGTNLVIPRFPYRSPQMFGSTILAIDTMFVLAGIMLCSSASQDLLIGYFLCIVMAAFGNSERRIAGAAFLVVGAYALWIFRNLGVSENLDAVSRSSLLIRLPFLFATTVFYGYMMQRVRREHSGRVRAEIRVRGLDCLLDVTRSFSSSLVTKEILEHVSDTIRKTLGVESCRIRLVNGHSDGFEPEVVAALERREAVSAPAGSRPGATWSILALPIVHGPEALGVLLIEAERRDGFEPAEIEFCQVIANAAASALKNARQYESLVEIERAKSEFLSNLSHELRTPLSAILGYSELAEDQLADKSGPAIGEYVQHIVRSASDLSRHVDNLLYLSQVTLGRERKQIQCVDLPALLDRTVEKARRLSMQRSVELDVQVDPSLGEVYVDGDKLERILQHILLNAVKFTEKGKVQVVAAMVNGEPGVALPQAVKPWERLVSLSIRDTGIGLDTADAERIFRGFQQVDGSSTRRHDGLGIGLAVCRRLTEILGGTIRVESRPGEGSLFEVLLPVQLQHAPHPA